MSGDGRAGILGVGAMLWGVVVGSLCGSGERWVVVSADGAMSIAAERGGREEASLCRLQSLHNLISLR